MTTPAIAVPDAQSDRHVVLLQAERLEEEARKLRDKASVLRDSLKPSILIELHDGDLVAPSVWVGGRRCLTLGAMPLDEALKEITPIARRLQQSCAGCLPPGVTVEF